MSTRISFQFKRGGKVSSLTRLLASNVTFKKKVMSQTWYRGQSEHKKLVPKIGRLHEHGGKYLENFKGTQEQNLLHRFRRRAYAFEGRILNDWEALFLGRHYGLPTRLLDWTANPLVALYFACCDSLDKRGCVWGIARVVEEENDLDMLKLANEGEDPFDLYSVTEKGRKPVNKTQDAVKILHPFYNSPRIVAQGGIFTFHSNPWVDLKSYVGKSFYRNRLDISHLIEWEIPARAKPKIIQQLDNLGVNRRTAYPDLEGLARGLWETEVLWKGKRKK